MSEKSKTYEHILPDIQDWPIYKFSEDRNAFIKKLTDYVLQKIISSHKATPLELLNKTIYQEQKRVKTSPWKVDPQDEKEYWNSLSTELENTKTADNPDLEQLKILKRIVNRYSEEIIGHFVPKSHLFARRFLTAFFKRLYNNGWGRGHRLFWGSKKNLLSKIHITGHPEEIRSLFKLGTVVMVPTHYSNLDSIQIAYAIDGKAGLPAFSYGAGLNLYDTEILAYYMNRLGAYRVDRRKKNPVYLETLKSMASLSLIDGLNHIFFPGGTRSRSGAIEERLKLGLLNSVIDAQRHSFVNEKPQRIFIVPLAIGYHFVLEAESLINQHLKVLGKEKYLRPKKKKSIFKLIYNFLVSLRNKDSEVYLSFGKPMDIMGNVVDHNGDSFDRRGNPIDVRSYFSKDDILNVDSQRESIYTKILAERIVESFKVNNVVLSSHFVAYVLFRHIEQTNEEMDLFELLKLNVKDINVPMDSFKQKAEALLQLLKTKAEKGEVSLSRTVEHKDLDEIIKDGISKVGAYHLKKVIKLKNKKFLSTEDLKLLYYYHNKLTHYDLPNY